VKPSLIKIGSLDPADAAVTLLQAESPASYASGHLLFARDDTLMAQPFDPEARRPTGDAFPLAENVGPEGSRYVAASVSANGTLVYADDNGLASRQLTWFDRSGRTLATLGDAGPYSDVALSPDERHVAISLATGSPENHDIWIIDVARNVRSRLTVDPGADRSPLWSRDGTQIAYEAERSGKVSIRQQSANGTGVDELLLEVPGTPSRPCGVSQCGVTPSGWSADGRHMAHTVRGSFPQTTDVWILPLFGDRKPFPLANTEFLEGSGTFSPDGKWIAYVTSEPGLPNVYVQPFPRPGGKYRVSRDGGHQPLWRADGKELFYFAPDGVMMTVAMDATGQFRAGAPQALFRTGATAANFFRQQYAVTKDGQRFLVNAPSQQSSGAQLTVVVNWPAATQK
jgi:Tol biopolymer transport system component